MPHILYLDTETYNEQPISKGVYAYAETVEIMLFQYAFNDGPVYVVDLANGGKLPQEVINLLLNPEVLLFAQNSMFDRTVLTRGNLLKDRPDIIDAISKPERWRDSMVIAYAHSLKGGLDDLCEIFKLETDKAKDKEGKALVQLFCKPRPKTSKIRRATSKTHPEEWEKFKHYAKQDIVSMREVVKKMPNWNMQDGSAELEFWHLDQRINDRGVCIDVDLATKAVECINSEQQRLADETHEMTHGEVQTATQRDAMLKHIASAYGITLNDLTASTIERRLSDPDLPDGLKGLLAVRQQASTTSTSKYKALLNRVNSDGRLRGTLQFMGAPRTGRWAGRGFQPQNLTRPTMADWEIEIGIDAIKSGNADLLTDNIMKLTSNTLRGCICAPEGKKLVVSDLSNIEGRVLAWLACESWKIKAFSDYDNGDGHDLYKLSYAKSFGVTPESVTKDQRQIGKVQELALGYEGGVGAFITFSTAYGIDLDAMADLAVASIDERIVYEAKSAYEWAEKNKRTYGLSAKAYIVCDAFKRSWREAHPNIANFWKELDYQVRSVITGAISNAHINNKLVIDKVGAWLRIQLPSGRYLCYPGARIDENGKISYMGLNTYSRKWERINTYGGKITENITQAVARDVMAWSMPCIDEIGFNIVLTVHDEIITEAPDVPEFSHDYLSQMLSTPPCWAKDLPLAAAGFESYRYKKD
ncbi:DNA polymerase I [Gilliamella sp. HK2]|uniref:DNA polymerase n=1 Tax=unclassified Gilliamella TaxID=2685620 RepID=UPI00080DD4D4|nr:DNA polymerase [Gilliamella apicola]OCG25935.1 DNA polymerase I [Gilliamella apicola]OCG30587.1 DNA polymerase I [Gilliamella apicola]